MITSKKAVDLIVAEEVSSKSVYEKKYTGIIVPPGDSGATIGIGYDLGYNTPSDIDRDWKLHLNQNTLSILKMFSGIKGDKARKAVASNAIAKQVNIPFDIAYKVFVKTSLVKFGRKSLNIYNGLDKLTPDAIGAIVSLVYNRGTDLTGERRTEMKNLVALITAKDYEGMANEFLKMRRLWNNGLVQRREREAALIKGSNRQYSNDELIEL
jgi:hypothetical protein